MSVDLSTRVQRIRPSPTVTTTALAAELVEQGKDIIGLSAGEPDFETPRHIREAAIDAINSGDTKYTAVDGALDLKEAVAKKFRTENGLKYQLDQILVSSGAKQVCYNACQALLEKGDEAVIPAPYWVSYPDMVRLAGADPVIVRTDNEAGFRMSGAQLAGALTERTRVLIINSPCNPTGSAYSRSDWQSLSEILIEYPKVFVITDDIYEHIYWGAEPFCSFLEACPEFYGRTLTVNGVSKCYAMTGWRVGYAGGPAKLIKAMKSIQSQSTTNACTISQAASVAALVGDQSCVAEMCKAFKERHDFVIQALSSVSGVICNETEGSFYVFPNVSEMIKNKGINDDVALCEMLLEKAGLALVPGTAFGSPGYLRMSFACGLETLTEAMKRLACFVES